jgi:biotin synthase
MYKSLINKAENEHRLSRDEIVYLLRSDEKVDSIDDELFLAADRVRSRFVGDGVHLRGLIEFTNICRNNCLYCGLRRDNKRLVRYSMSDEEILLSAKKAIELGYLTIVLQGGEDVCFDSERLANIISEIKKDNIAISLSIGELSYDDYMVLKDAGADRFLLRIETTDKELYHKLNPNMSWENRVRCLNNLRDLRYEVGSGCLVGLPGQTIESLADDILFFQQMKADMIGIGPFIPNEDTPLKNEKGGDYWMALRVMAITRLLLPGINIPATSAMETLEKDGRMMALQCGANVIMPNVTDSKYREYYALYPGKISVKDSPEHNREIVEKKVVGIGRRVEV